MKITISVPRTGPNAPPGSVITKVIEVDQLDPAVRDEIKQMAVDSGAADLDEMIAVGDLRYTMPVTITVEFDDGRVRHIQVADPTPEPMREFIRRVIRQARQQP